MGGGGARHLRCLALLAQSQVSEAAQAKHNRIFDHNIKRVKHGNTVEEENSTVGSVCVCVCGDIFILREERERERARETAGTGSDNSLTKETSEWMVASDDKKHRRRHVLL